MLEPHPPHGAVLTWQAFLIHIATIVVGLFIAVALEQTVEFFHHRHQSRQLQEQMLEVFASDLQLDEVNFKQLIALRAYLIELRASVAARLHGQSAPSPPANDSRMATFPRFPSLAPYEAAKDNGTIALLSTDRIRLYNRVAFSRELLGSVRDHWFEGLIALAAFDERFVESRGSLELGASVTAPEVSPLSTAELTEYLALISSLIKRTDLFFARLQLFDAESRAVLNGVGDEDELMRHIAQIKAAEFIPPDSLPAHK